MNILEWAHKHHVSSEAMAELFQGCNLFPVVPVGSSRSEAAVQTDVRLEGAQLGIPLWRNNVGAYKDERGGMVRYGLANDSKSLNARIKSGDLIGIRPILITPAHVGKVIGQFVSREVKAESWQYRGTDREEAQLRWQLLVQKHGGDACFVTGKGTL